MCDAVMNFLSLLQSLVDDANSGGTELCRKIPHVAVASKIHRLLFTQCVCVLRRSQLN